MTSIFFFTAFFNLVYIWFFLGDVLVSSISILSPLISTLLSSLPHIMAKTAHPKLYKSIDLACASLDLGVVL